MYISDIAYEKYKIDWMLQHDITLDDLVINVVQYVKTHPDVDWESVLSCWERNCGFRSTMYRKFEDFMDNEFKDEDYMRQILTTDEFIEWQNYWLR